MSHSIKKLNKAILFAASMILCFLIPGALYAQLPYMPQTDVNVPDQSIYLEAGGNGRWTDPVHSHLFEAYRVAAHKAYQESKSTISWMQ